MKDVIINPPSNGKYQALKKFTLIQRLTDSQEHRIRQLLETEEIGDRKPTQFLRHLSALAGTAVSEKLLRTLWLGRLSAQMQITPATRRDDLHSVADRSGSNTGDRKQNNDLGNFGTITNEDTDNERRLCGRTTESSSSINDTSRTDG